MIAQVYFKDPDKHLDVTVHSTMLLYDETYPNHATVYLMDAIGPHSAVRGVLSALQCGRELRCPALDPELSLTGSYRDSRTLTARRTKAATHGLFLHPALSEDPDAYQIAVLADDPKSIFDHLMRRFTVPALPEWADWLARKLEKDRRLTRLKGFGAKGVLLRVDEKTLDETVAEAVKTGKGRF